MDVVDDNAEALSKAPESSLLQPNVQPQNHDTDGNVKHDERKLCEPEQDAHQLPRDHTAATTNGQSDATHLNGNQQLSPVITDATSQHATISSEATSTKQLQHGMVTGGPGPAEHSVDRHQAAAVFDPQAAKQAAAADQAIGAVVEEVNAADNEPIPHAQQESPDVKDDVRTQPASSGDVPQLTTAGSAKLLATRSSSRHAQLQAKSAPWR